MSFRTEEYYKRFIELQEKLRKSEEERLKLEMKFNEMVQVTREEEQMHYRKLRAKYTRFLEEDRRRQERNERILRSLERIESRVAMLVAKTERFKLLRQQYQHFLDRIYRTKQEKFEIEKPKTDDIVQSYIQNLSSNKLREMLRKEERLDSEFYPFEGDSRPNYANSIADDIMSSIYSKPSKGDDSKRLSREFNNNIWSLYGVKEPEFANNAKSSTDDGSDIDEIPYKSGVSDAVKNFVRMGKRDSLVEQQTKIGDSVPREETEQKISLEEIEENIKKANMIDHFESPREKEDVSKSTSKSSSHLQPEQQQEEIDKVDQIDQVRPEQQNYEQREEIVEEKEPVQVVENEPKQSVVDESKQQYDNEQPIQAILEQHYTDQGQFDQQQEQQYVDKELELEKQQDENSSYPVAEQQYDESGQPIPTQQYDDQDPFVQQYENGQDIQEQQYNEGGQQYGDQGQFMQQYDENGQPVEQYYESGQPIQQYDTNGQLIQQNNEQGQFVQQYGDSGQPVQQYDENGQLIQQYDENGQLIQQNNDQGQFVQQYGDSGQPVQQYDENGQLIQQYDENGQLIQQNNDQGQFVQQYGDSGQPIQQYDENGQLIQESNEQGQSVQQYDESGQPVQQYDEHGQLIQHNNDQGQFIQQYDESGQQYDESGQPLEQPIQQYDEQYGQQYDQHGQYLQQYDESGQPIQQYDENGQPVQQYDETGQYMQQYDENGQPIQQYDENAQYYADQSNVQYGENVEQQQPIEEAKGNNQDIPSEAKKSNILELLDTDTESVKQESKVSHDSDFDFSNE